MTKLHVLRPAIATPFTRAVCREWQFACNLTGCRYNLRHADQRRDAGGRPGTPVPLSTVVRFGGCALNAADAGARTLDEVGELLGVTSKAVQQIEERALRKLLRLSAAERAYRESEGQADRAGASLPGGLEDE